MRRLSLIAAIILACDLPAGADLPDFMIGVKIYEHKGDLLPLFERWKQAGINTAFVSADLANDPNFMALARERQIRTFVILPIFYDAAALARQPDLYAQTGRGRPAEQEWVKFVCPTREDYRSAKIEYIRDLVRTCHPDGLSLDFIRYFVFWEKVYPDSRPDPMDYACFCPNCLHRFGSEMNINIPGLSGSTESTARWVLSNHAHAWVDWKCRNVTSMVREIVKAARVLRPDILINVHLVPWRENDFDGGIRSIAGQDVAAIDPLVNYLSPMCYAHMVKRDAQWIHSVVSDIGRRAKKPVIPSVQVKEAYLKEKLTAAEFRRYLEEVRRPPSRGVIFWNWPMLAEDEEKLGMVRSVLLRK